MANYEGDSLATRGLISVYPPDSLEFYASALSTRGYIFTAYSVAAYLEYCIIEGKSLITKEIEAESLITKQIEGKSLITKEVEAESIID